MRVVGAFTILLGLVAAGPSWAQRAGAGAGGRDACEQQANQLYSTMRNLDERMRVKREYVRDCRAKAGGGRR